MVNSPRRLALAAALALACSCVGPALAARSSGPQALSAGPSRIGVHKSAPPRPPRVFVYPLEPELTEFGHDGESRVILAKQLIKGVKREFGTENGDDADYYLIPSTGHYPSPAHMLRMYDAVRQRWPWWNRTREAGQARHIMLMLGDWGPGSAAYGLPIDLNDPHVPPDVHPLNPNRTVLFLMWNGLRDRGDDNWKQCQTCFDISKDIMIPTGEMICGPLCGYDAEELRRKSIWSLPEPELQQEMRRKRKHRLFWAGLIREPVPDDYTGRGGIYHHYRNRSGYLVVRKGEGPRINFADAMRDSEFCFSPMGQNGGDTDRYVAAIMFGCVPVMLNSSYHTAAVPHALPLEELLRWERFGTIANAWDLERLDEQLRCLEPHLPAMRHAMREVWQQLLWSRAYQRSYLGEDGSRDAMHAVVQILAQRAQHGFKPPPALLQRMAHHSARRFPCTARPVQFFPRRQPQQDLGQHSRAARGKTPH